MDASVKVGNQITTSWKLIIFFLRSSGRSIQFHPALWVVVASTWLTKYKMAAATSTHSKLILCRSCLQLPARLNYSQRASFHSIKPQIATSQSPSNPIPLLSSFSFSHSSPWRSNQSARSNQVSSPTRFNFET